MHDPPPSLALLGLAMSVAIAALSLGAAFGSAGPGVWPAIGLAWSTALLLGSLVALAARRGAKGRGLLLGSAALTLSIGTGLTAALLQGVPSTSSSLWGGLPPGAALLIYGVGLLPALVVPVVYALTFDRSTLGPDDLQRLRDLHDASETRGGRSP